MPSYQTLSSSGCVMGRLAYGGDLLEELTAVCIDRGVTLGWVQAIGAVTRARLGYYNQQTREYQYTDFDHPMEITALVGNVSLKEGRPMVHAHVTLAAEDGRTIGGHLASGTQIFACEFVLRELEGPSFERKHDPQTDLPLWK